MDEWEPVDLDELVSKLAPGEMVTSDKFSLLDSMTATEIMNSKMDIGMNYKTRLSEEMIVQRCISGGIEEYSLEIMDTLFMLTLMYTQGNNLAISVFTLPLLTNFDKFYPKPDQSVVHLFVDSYLTLLVLLNEILRTVELADEEEFLDYTFGRNLLGHRTPGLNLEEEVQKSLQALKNPACPLTDAEKKRIDLLAALLSSLTTFHFDRPELSVGIFDQLSQLCGDILQEGSLKSLPDHLYYPDLNKSLLSPGPSIVAKRVSIEESYTVWQDRFALWTSLLATAVEPGLSLTNCAHLFRKMRTSEMDLTGRTLICRSLHQTQWGNRLIDQIYPDIPIMELPAGVPEFAQCLSDFMAKYLVRLLSQKNFKQFRNTKHVSRALAGLQIQAFSLDDHPSKKTLCSLVFGFSIMLISDLIMLTRGIGICADNELPLFFWIQMELTSIYRLVGPGQTYSFDTYNVYLALFFTSRVYRLYGFFRITDEAEKHVYYKRFAKPVLANVSVSRPLTFQEYTEHIELPKEEALELALKTLKTLKSSDKIGQKVILSNMLNLCRFEKLKASEKNIRVAIEKPYGNVWCVYTVSELA